MKYVELRIFLKQQNIQPRDAYTYLEYHFLDKNGEEIK